MIHNYSNQPIYDLLRLINDVEKKITFKAKDCSENMCDLCGGLPKEGSHSVHCELDKMRKIIKSLECGDD